MGLSHLIPAAVRERRDGLPGIVRGLARNDRFQGCERCREPRLVLAEARGREPVVSSDLEPDGHDAGRDQRELAGSFRVAARMQRRQMQLDQPSGSCRSGRWLGLVM
jgi:hypothetical protein